MPGYWQGWRNENALYLWGKIMTFNSKLPDSTYIPAGHYVTKTQAAKMLNKSLSFIQYHIDKEHIETIQMGGAGHLLRVGDVERFVPMTPGRPTSYEVIDNV